MPRLILTGNCGIINPRCIWVDKMHIINTNYNMPLTRAKFRCTEITTTSLGQRVKMEPVTNGCTENAQFFKLTPYGSVDMGTLNPEVEFKPGKCYYVDFTEAPG